MAITTFKGAVPIEDWSNLRQNYTPVNVDLTPIGRMVENVRQEKQRQKQEYLKMANANPVFTVNKYWQEEQGKKINEFQDYIADIYQKSKNKPSLEEMLDIQNHKQALLMWQNNLVQSNEQYKNIVKALESDPLGLKYDKEHAYKKLNDWLNNSDGSLPKDILLPPLVGDLRGYYEGLNWTGDEMTTKTDAGGKIITETKPLDENGLKSRATNQMFKDPSLHRTVAEKWDSLPPEEKKKWLSQYGENAITEWNYQNFGKYAFKNKRTIADKTGSQRYSVNIPKSLEDIPSFEKRSIINNQVPYDIQKFGIINFSKDINSRRISSRPYYDLKTGTYKDTGLKGDDFVSDIGVEYLPVKDGEILKGESYRYSNNELAEGVKIKPFVVGIKDGKEVAYPYSKEWDNFITINARPSEKIEEDITYRFKSTKEVPKMEKKDTNKFKPIKTERKLFK